MQALRERAGDAVTEAAARSAFEQRVEFRHWFYYVEGLLYVEHGHQYDEYCSFDYQLHPVEGDGNLALSISHAGIRYFTLMAANLGAIAQQIADAGYETPQPLAEFAPVPGMGWMFVADPDGNWVELVGPM